MQLSEKNITYLYVTFISYVICRTYLYEDWRSFYPRIQKYACPLTIGKLKETLHVYLLHVYMSWTIIGDSRKVLIYLHIPSNTGNSMTVNVIWQTACKDKACKLVPTPTGKTVSHLHEMEVRLCYSAIIIRPCDKSYVPTIHTTLRQTNICLLIADLSKIYVYNINHISTYSCQNSEIFLC